MGRIADLIKHMMTKGRESDAENVEALRTAFKARYHQFKLLLNANNKALDIMAEMEEALKGIEDRKKDKGQDALRKVTRIHAFAFCRLILFERLKLSYSDACFVHCLYNVPSGVKGDQEG